MKIYQMFLAKASKRIPSLCFALVLILSSILSFNSIAAAPEPPKDGAFKVVPLPRESLHLQGDFQVSQQSTDNPKMDSAMAQVQRASKISPRMLAETAKNNGVRFTEGQVHAQIVVQHGRENLVSEAIARAGGEVTGMSNDGLTLQGWLPVYAIESIAALPGVNMIRKPPEPVLLENPYAVDTTSEGLAVLNGPAWHAVAIRGAGVKVGVIDGGFTGYKSLLGSELPSSVTAKNFVDGENDSQVDGSSPHGTACSEIIHDVAPDAALYLAKIDSNIDLQEAVSWLKNTHYVDIISTSLGWLNVTPGDGSGQFANLVQDARNNGILWATAAANYRQEHWGGLFNDMDGNGYHNYSSSQEINFYGPGGGSAYLIPAGVYINAYLRWDDWTFVNQDYDLLLLRWNGSSWSEVASSINPQSGAPGQSPTEEIKYYTPPGNPAIYGFVFYRRNSTRNVNLEFFAVNVAPLDKIVTPRSLANLADSPGAMTVAALDVQSPYPQETYSSEGPTNGPGGTETGGFLKPDISGYAQVSTQSYGYKDFAGTSAAAPHAAGAAALVQSADLSFPPDLIQRYLQSNAVDLGATGADTVFGYGRLYLGDPALVASPHISGLPDQLVPQNGVLNQAIDLWTYASDPATPVNQLSFSIDNTPDSNAGISLQSNRYININPSTDWQGQTSVAIRVTDPGGLFDTDTFKLSVGVIWNGVASSAWFSDTNWTPGSLPASDDHVYIPTASNQPEILTGTVSVQNLTLLSGASLNLTTRSLNVAGSLDNSGAITQTRVVTEGMTTDFVHITNQAKTSTKYRGLALSPSGNPSNLVFESDGKTPPGAGLLPSGPPFTTTVSVAIYGAQFCPEHSIGVGRCYSIEPAGVLSATVRFYFTEAERNGYSLDSLVAFRSDQGRIEEPGPYSYGGSANEQYIQSPLLSKFSLFSLAKSGEAYGTLLPAVMKDFEFTFPWEP